MKRFFVFLFLAITAFSSLAYSQEKNDYPFQSGEKLNFVMNYTWGGVVTDVGAATCQVTYSDGYYNVLLTGRSFKFFDMFFKVRERFETKFSEETFRPVRFHREASEGKYYMNNTLLFNKNYTINSHTQKKNRPPLDTLLIGTAGTRDLLTLFFKYRTMDFPESSIGVKKPLEFVIDKEIYNLYFIYLGKETKKIPGAGTFKTMKFAAKVVAGNVFDGKEDMTIWVSDDQNKIPLFFESPVIVGKVQGRISTIQGNKYPLSSKVK
ncbi:MAG: DUF3108 domain-containing protein [Bacteroidales bacterium]|nr:DUF3108 domain-containing protein [Bacteroidales bacterium]